MRKFLSVIIFIFIFLLSTKNAFAIYDPLSVPNNKFGIHIINDQDLKDAENLTNSSGGDWGYVTLVITESQRDTSRWQKVFDSMRRMHLIPIVRIATNPTGDTWGIPDTNQINSWASFLNSLNWVTQNKYVVVLNEPNHAKEWGGKIDPKGYAEYLKLFSTKLKSASDDFYILPAGLDASAKNTPQTMDETQFLNAMVKDDPNIFDYIDGWTSHSYPNPDFSGKETDKGRGTVDTFDWEMTYLKKIGLKKDLPIFITETGWSNKKLDEHQISGKFQYAFQNVWSDPRIVAVTPFVLNYGQEPFVEFSWKNNDGTFRAFYDDVRKLSKTPGQPKQINTGSILAAIAQPLSLPNSNFAGALIAKNTGQTIWDPTNIFVAGASDKLDLTTLGFNPLEPPNIGIIFFKAKSPNSTGLFGESVFLKDKKGNKITNNFSIESAVVKPDLMQVQAFFGKIATEVKNFIKL